MDLMRNVVVVPHDVGWARAFEAEARLLAEGLGAVARAIHHIGSTSVPGLAAKPILDILLVVPDLASLDAREAAMVALGYAPRGELGIPGRRYFPKGGDVDRTHHVHAFAEGHPEIARHLAFRDHLRAHPSDARRYGALKEALAGRHPHDIEAYMAGKDAFIKGILALCA